MDSVSVAADVKHPFNRACARRMRVICVGIKLLRIGWQARGAGTNSGVKVYSTDAFFLLAPRYEYDSSRSKLINGRFFRGSSKFHRIEAEASYFINTLETPAWNLEFHSF